MVHIRSLGAIDHLWYKVTWLLTMNVCLEMHVCVTSRRSFQLFLRRFVLNVGSLLWTSALSVKVWIIVSLIKNFINKLVIKLKFEDSILLVKILFSVILEQVIRKEMSSFLLLTIYIHSRPLRSLHVSMVWNIWIYELIRNNTVKIRNNDRSLIHQIYQVWSVIIV